MVCHNAASLNTPAVSGGLALDSYAALQKGVVLPGKAHALYTPGKIGGSELLRRLTTSSPIQLMPRGGPPLPPAQVLLFKRWIEAGAPAGKLTSEASVSTAQPDALPMPANPGAEELFFLTQIKPPSDLLDKKSSKDSVLSFALKVGPLSPITALAYSPDGTRLAVGGYRAVTLWDTVQGKPLACRTHLAGQVQSLAFRPDGALLAVAGGVAGGAGETRVFDATTLAPVGAALTGHADVVYQVCWSSDGKRLATAGQDKTARLWEWPSGKALKVFRDHSDAVMCVCLTADGKFLYTASQDHNVRRFDTATGQTLQTFSGSAEAVTALAVSPDGNGVVSSGPEQRLRWWNLSSGETSRYSDGSAGPVNALTFSKDGKLLASVAADRAVRLWDAGNGGQQRALEGAGDWLYAVAISPDGKFAAGAGADGVVRLWETATGRLRLSLLAWPPTEKTAGSASAEAAPTAWAVLTPEGFFDTASGWTARVRLTLAGAPIPTPRRADFLTALRQPQNVQNAWHGAPMKAAELPALPKPPIVPAGKRAAGAKK